MNPNEDKPNFLDRGTVIAFALMFLVWFGWSKFMETKYPQAPAQTAASTPPPENPPTQSKSATAPAATVAANTAAAPSPIAAPSDEKIEKFDDENLSFEISSEGMGIRNVDVRKFKTRANEPIILGSVKSDYPFATNLAETGKPIPFTIERQGNDTFVGRATLNGLQIEKTMKVQSATYSIDTVVKVSGQTEGFKGLSTSVSEPLLVTEPGGFLSSSSAAEHQEFFLRHDNTKTRKIIQAKEGLQLTQQNVSIAALSSHYFTLAISDRSDLLPRFESNVAPASTVAAGRLVYQPVSRPDVFTVHYVSFAGPKSFELLGKIDENMSMVVDYGMFGLLGKPILWLLKFLQTVIGNWGWSIVVLTIIVRAIVLPFNAYSYKSMKAMQRIQPEMNRIKERYKDKPTDQRIQMNQEIMQLMKQNKASPLGGCLPTLLQLPVFFALYQVLGQSIELYRQPFIFWIHDLSARDPFFVLPVLMGATMFIQQKLTPTTMDPQQAKILMWMPVIFSVFMLSLPSGLTLYIFVSTLFGIIQQYIFMRDKSTASGRVKEAKA